MKIIAVYDKKALSYMPPMFVNNRIHAVRYFERAVNANPENSDIARYPHEYNLQELGEFNELLGAFSIHQNAIILHEASEFINKEQFSTSAQPASSYLLAKQAVCPVVNYDGKEKGMFKTLYTTLSKRVREPFVSDKPTKTIQEPKAACDINNIVDLYCRQGRAADLLSIQPWQGEDVSSIPTDYMECLEYVNAVQEDFDNLPSAVRKEVGNSPMSMLQWITNPANKERGVELGLFERLPVEPVDVGSVSNTGVSSNVEPVPLEPVVSS